MRKRDLIQIKKMLTQQLMELLARDDCSLEEVGESDDNLSDILDRAAKIAERNFSHHLCSREKLLIRKIERSLRDIENGDYGRCEHCEEEISVKRLKARPTARYCIDCKTQLETMERLTGVDVT
ncbi:MAG: TraR/DksA C4-type zinc finger protein [Deltaproteobacteria bacterium]|nr:TraR/DksA C4-type zinc finger protein [Deltaproteobacteria bacterium]